VKTIWKFPLKVQQQEIQMPIGAVVLHVEAQYERPCMWALVDPEAATERRVFFTIGTGHRLPIDHVHHVGSYQLQNGAFVGHVFEALQ